MYLHATKIRLSERKDEAMILSEIKNIYHKELVKIYPIEEVDSFFYWMISHYLGLERFALALQPNLSVTHEEEQPLFEGLSQLKLEIPIQYILGETEFMDLKFLVNKNVLIPRPETEELVRWIIEEFRGQRSEFRGQNSEYSSQEPKAKSQKLTTRILDIGTGSGCIAISLAKNLPNVKVYALDVSEEALKVAKENAELNEVEVEFIHADILELESLGEKFDIVVSNPPYVRELEKAKMNNNVLNNEPELALFVSDNEPLVFYNKITQFVKENLNEGCALYFEINQYLGKETQQLLEEANFSEIELRKDMHGKDRMLRGINTESS